MHTDMLRRRLLASIAPLTLLLGVSPALADIIYSESFEQESALGQYYSATGTSNYSGFGNFLGRFGNQTVRLDLLSSVTGGAHFPTNTSGHDITSIDANFEHGVGVLDTGIGGGSSGGGTIGDNPTLDLANGGPAVDDGLYHAGTYAVTFDLYLFDSWDWSYEGFGPDGFAVAVNGETLFDELFDSHWLPNNFRLPDEQPGSAAGNPSWADYIYRDITLEFTTVETLEAFAIDFIGTPNQNLIDESWGIDNIRLSSVTRSASIPAPGSIVLLGMGLTLAGARRRGR